MVRAAAKNTRTSASSPTRPTTRVVLDELRAGGVLSDATSAALARKAFAHTAAYDAPIVAWFDEGADDPLPPTLHLALERVQELRYGENPHQTGRPLPRRSAPRRGGTTSSSTAAWRSATSTSSTPTRRGGWPTTSPRPPAGRRWPSSSTPTRAARPWPTRSPRPTSGPSSATSAPPSAASSPCRDAVDDATVERMVAAAQADVVIAPGYADGVIEALAKKRKNTRLLTAAPPAPDALQIRQLTGSWLVQDPHHFAAPRADWRVVTKRAADRGRVGRRRAGLAAGAAG